MMLRYCSALLVLKALCLCLQLIACRATAQTTRYVDPFIGTDEAFVHTLWGKEGGTYPGAVAPWGFMQLTPETRQEGGYSYRDTVVRYFSCTGHKSGYPNGSAGRVHIMPVATLADQARPFSHLAETAKPGYYRVRLADDGTLVEATANQHVGAFRFTFPENTVPYIRIADCGLLETTDENTLIGSRYGVTLRASQPFHLVDSTSDGYHIKFSNEHDKPTVVTLLVSASGVGSSSSLRNILHTLTDSGVTIEQAFDHIFDQTTAAWEEVLTRFEVTDNDENQKRIFFTALYHACLLPWVISDVDGKYRGRDGNVYQRETGHEYGGFSPWDTFRSLHPLIQLVYPEINADMVKAMIHVAEQSGALPADPMTGNHAIPILVDSYFKDRDAYDSLTIYQAIKSSIYHPPFIKDDFSTYHALGYVPAERSESVTRTLEYNYNDWAFERFARLVMRDPGVADTVRRRSQGFLKIFDSQELLFLPKGKRGFVRGGGTFGYKEGDAAIYSYFLPQHAEQLVALMGGDSLFSAALHQRLEQEDVVFDNEPAFHIPYLFAYAGRPDKTQYWLHKYRTERFSSSPGGVPGNDDLGSMSSWYVFAALGIYPLAPGVPTYTVGTPVFDRVTINLPRGKQLTITKQSTHPNAYYVDGVWLGTDAVTNVEITHDELLRVGALHFTLDTVADTEWNRRVGLLKNTDNAILLERATPLISTALPGDTIPVEIVLHNTGETATKRLVAQDQFGESTYSNVLLHPGETRIDTFKLVLYAFGHHHVRLDNATFTVDIQRFSQKVRRNSSKQPYISEVAYHPLVKHGDSQQGTYLIRNIDGERRRFTVPIQLEDKTLYVDSVWLNPGEAKRLSFEFTERTVGQHILTIGINTSVSFTVYDQPLETRILTSGDNVIRLRGAETVQHWPGIPLLSDLGQQLTLMLWVKPTQPVRGIADILSKGDHHVIQTVGGRRLNFFAGGWGRGECTVPLPAEWVGQWHHLVGVCTGEQLLIYINGQLAGTAPISPSKNLMCTNTWALGGNSEFPDIRYFFGDVAGLNVFKEALSEQDIRHIMESSRVLIANE